jgi:hypothetical protein
MKPTLTRPRWRALKKLEATKGKPFIGTDVGVKGPSLVSLEECGWVERIEAPADDTPFAIATQGHHWRVTDAGRAALAALPENPPRRT